MIFCGGACLEKKWCRKISVHYENNNFSLWFCDRRQWVQAINCTQKKNPCSSTFSLYLLLLFVSFYIDSLATSTLFIMPTVRSSWQSLHAHRKTFDIYDRRRNRVFLYASPAMYRYLYENLEDVIPYLSYPRDEWYDSIHNYALSCWSFWAFSYVNL